jgi:uncharacterized iron-regulated membrane protein
LRRALFQVHLWSGIVLSLYIVVLCVSGSAIVFRRELDKTLCPTNCEPQFVTALAEFHDNLSGGHIGLRINGLAAVAVILLSLSGALVWWPGAKHVWRGMTVRRHVAWHRLLRDLHGALGIWLFLVVLLWAVTGIYFAFPEPFNALADVIVNAGVSAVSVDDAIAWVVRLHFGRAFGHGAEVVWVVFGLLPAALVVTGIITWWHRVRR